MSLGLSKKIENMEPKKKKLFQNMISIWLLFLMFYCVYRLFEGLYLTDFNPIAALMLFLHRDLALVLILGIFLLMGNAVLKGKRLPVPQGMLQNSPQTQQTQQTSQKPKFNIPDSYSTKRYKVKPDKKVKPRLMSQKSKVIGTWKCPTCRHLAIGSRCDRCGRRYSR